MIDILGLFTGITTAVIGSSFAVYTVIKNSQNNEDEDPYAGIYDDVPTSLWRERMTDEDEEDDWEEPLF